MDTIRVFCSLAGACFLHQASLASLNTINDFELRNGKITLNGVSLTGDDAKHHGASDTKSFTLDRTKYYFKLIDEYKTFDALCASRVLSVFFKGEKQRFPNLYLGINKAQKIFLLSEELKEFNTINKIDRESNPFSPDFANRKSILKDLNLFYTALLLGGIGDIHAGNVAFSTSKNIFGDIDLDVAFKAHISFSASYEEKGKERFDSSDLALREFDCSDPLKNFLSSTDSNIQTKKNWGGYFQEFYLDDNKDILNAESLLEAMTLITSISLDKYKSAITDTGHQIEHWFTERNKHFPPNLLRKEEKIKFLEKRYNLMNDLAKKYKTDDGKELHQKIKDWCSDYLEKSKTQNSDL